MMKTKTPKINARAKGKRGELDVRNLFREFGYTAERGGQQGNGGSADNPDVVHDMPGVHAEVKRVEAYRVVNQAFAQAQRDAGQGRVPVLFARSDRQEWLVTITAAEWFRLKALDF